MANHHMSTIVRLGTSEITVAFTDWDGDSLHQPQVVWVKSLPSKGVKKGRIVDINEARNVVDHLFDLAYSQNHDDPERLLLISSGADVKMDYSQGVAYVETPDRSVGDAEINSSFENALKIFPQSATHSPVIHMPESYLLDGREVDNPFNMKGSELKVKLATFSLPTATVQDLQTCFSDYPITAIVPKGMAAAYGCLSESDWAGCTMLISCGGGVTTAVLVSENRIVAMKSAPVGGAHFTSDLVTMERMPYNVAERLKKLVPLDAEPGPLPEELSGWNLPGVREVVSARVNQIIERVILPFRTAVESRGFRPATVVLEGGVCQTPGFLERVQQALDLPVRIVEKVPAEETGDLDKVIAGATMFLWYQMRNQHFAHAARMGDAPERIVEEPSFRLPQRPRETAASAASRKERSSMVKDFFKSLKDLF